MEFNGKTAFITGGAQGIGLGIARTLAQQGVRLALADIDEAALATAKADLDGITAVETYVLDVRDREKFAEVADHVESTVGPVSLLFNNAGVAGSTSVSGMSFKMWDWVLGINLHGVVNGIQTFLPRMIERGEGGHVVNTSSGAGMAATGSGYLYCTSKYAVVGMSESLRLELEQTGTGIGVSVLCPGPVATGIVTRSVTNRPDAPKITDPAALARIAAVEGMLQEGVTPDQVGEMVLNGIKENAQYVFTDRIVADAVIDRARAIIAAMPDSDDDDEGLVDFTAATQTDGITMPRRTRSYTVEETVPASPDDLFALIADPARSVEWSKGHAGWPDGAPTDLSPGATFRQRVDSMGSTSELAWTVTQMTPPRTFEMIAAGPMGVKIRTLFEVAANGDGSDLAVTTEMGGGPLTGPLGQTAIKNSEQEQRVALQKLKSLFAS